MKSRFLVLPLIILFVTAAFGQRSSDFTLRPGLASNDKLAGLTRSRVASDSGGGGSLSSLAGRLEREVFRLLNSERRRNGLNQLEWSEEVAVVARQHSNNMAYYNFFSHRGADGLMVDDRADRLGLTDWQSIGENIAYMRGYDDPARLAVEKWMDSKEHRRNLLAPNWKESAVGVAIKPDGTYYFTQVFIMRR